MSRLTKDPAKDPATHCRDLVGSLARLIMYETECGACGQSADEPNGDCEDHRPFAPTEANDPEDTLNSLIREAREVIRGTS